MDLYEADRYIYDLLFRLEQDDVSEEERVFLRNLKTDLIQTDI